jgi:valyl-tRNA synthetase
MDDKAYMNEFAGPYEGLERYEARKKIVADLETQDLLLEIEPHQHNVGECYRCSTVIEPIISMQWFVNMKPLAEPAIKAVRNDEVQFCPDRFSKIYFNWMENIKDWCISRQLWWGHRIPAYYCGNCGHITVSKVEVTKCEKCDSTDIRQDEDTLDTWFSSALWPFSTLGWPEKTKDLEYFYPTSVLVTAYDIIFFWVARMIFSGYEHMGQRPFEKVFIHGLVRDSQGKKMSKSLGNGIDPLALIEKYGADALRFAMSMGVSPGSDVRFSEEKIESARNIINKIWNAARFVMIQTDDADNDNTDISVNELTLEDKWILSRLNIIVDEITENLDKFEIGLALQKVYEFFREEFCDWYIELVKPRLYDNSKPTGNTARKVLVKVLSDSMKLFHPFIPFVTEEIYLAVNEDEKSIMISEWPIVDESFIFPEEESKMRLIMDAIRSIRNARAEINVPPSIKAEIFFVCSDETIKSSLELGRYYLERLAFASKINIFVKGSSDVVIPDNAVSAFVDGLDIYLPLDQLVDIEKEIVRLTEEQANLQGELDRVNGKLTNNSFVDRAPAKVVEEERAKLDKYNSMYKSVTEKLFQLKQMKKGD